MNSPRKARRKNTIARSRLLENAISGLRHRNFVEFKSHADFEKTGLFPPTCYVIRNYPHPTLYGTPGKKEAFVFYRGARYVFEAKYQNTSGSVDEKIGTLWLSFLQSPVPNWIVWFDGNYWRKDPRGIAIIKWLRDRIREHTVGGRHLYVCASDDEWHELAQELFRHELAG